MKIKKSPLILLAAPIAAFLIILTAMSPSPQTEEKKLDLRFPDDVTKILTASCFDCHTAGAKSEKAVNKLNFSSWNELTTPKKIHKLDEISEEIMTGSMPPEKYLARFPEKKLSAEQITLLNKWVKDEGAKLLAK